MYMRFSIRWAVVACLAVMLTVSSLSAEELTLSQAVEMAISSNPSIAAGVLSAEAAKQSAIGARALANPEILVAPTVIGDAGSDSAVFVSQPLEINGSRGARGEVASNEAAAAGFEAMTTRQDVVLRVNQSYWDVVRTQELVKLNNESIEYLQSLNAAVQRQLEVGTVPGSQLVKTEVELARARQELARGQLELTQARSTLNSLLNRPNDTDFIAIEPLTFREHTPDKASLLASALAGRPELFASEAQVAAARGAIRVARLQSVPDLAVQARKETFESGGSHGVALVLSLPVLDWGSVKADVKQAETTKQSREKQLEALRNSVLLDVELALQQVNTSSQVVREYQGGILAKSEELAAMARKGYEKGASSYLEVLEAQRTLRSVRSDYTSAMAEHAKALSQLEWAAGRTISRTEVEK